MTENELERGICDDDFFLTFTIGKFENSKFQNFPSEPERLWSYFEITNMESECQQRTSQMNESE